MKSFKQFVKEMNDNPDPDAVAKQRRDAIKKANKSDSSPAEKEFYEKKSKILAGLKIKDK